VRAGILMVLVAWTAAVVAGSNFANISEHFDEALPRRAGAHQLPDIAYTAIQTAASVSALIVIAGAGLALPSFVRFLQAGGWHTIRGHAVRAAVCTFVSALATAGLAELAHHLTDYQRNGGSTAYTVLFFLWALLIVVTLVLWTVLAVSTARQITFSRSLLAAEAGMAVAVAFGVVDVLVSTALWWVAMAERAPSFVSGNPASPMDTRLVASVALLAIAVAVAMAGAVRMLRCLPATFE
jgi:hypothetical protein